MVTEVISFRLYQITAFCSWSRRFRVSVLETVRVLKIYVEVAIHALRKNAYDSCPVIFPNKTSYSKV